MLRRRLTASDDFTGVILGRPTGTDVRAAVQKEKARTEAFDALSEEEKVVELARRETEQGRLASEQSRLESDRAADQARRAAARAEAKERKAAIRNEAKERREAQRAALASEREASQANLQVRRLAQMPHGRVNVSPRGFAFVTTDEGQAYFVRPHHARRLLTGDIIHFRAKPSQDDGSYDVSEIRHVTRREQILLCEVKNLAELTYLVPDEPCFTPVQAVDASVLPHAVDDVIALRLPAYSGGVKEMSQPPGGPLLGALVANLGPRTRNGFDLDYARMKHGFEQDLPAGLNELAERLEDPTALAATSWEPYVTIDGESTKDFDDAVFAEPREGGGWLVRVAISDVSHYVKPGTELDNWASSRCTSVYLPGLTLPMLPEGLSTHRCSLMPGVTRRAVVMRIVLDAQGNVVKTQIGRELIASAARLTYREVADFLSKPEPDRFAPAVETNLHALHEVYKLLAVRRKELGRLDFEDPEPTVKFRDGKLVVEWEVRNDAHKLVEELMLLANQAAAGMLVRRYGLGLMRHQPRPTAEAWVSLQQWAKAQSHVLAETPSLKAMSDLVMAMPEGEQRAEAVMKVRMSMQPARYLTMTGLQLNELGGHFSLCAPWYTHFTSPIRRYADLLVHRLLLAPEGTTLSEEEVATLRSAVEQCSDRSQASRLAERLMWDRLKLKGLLEEHDQSAVLGSRVVRVTPRGFRVVLGGWQVSGWLPGALLRKSGFSKNPQDVWVRGEGATASPVREGLYLPVSWTDVNLERPAYPELQVKLAIQGA